MLCRNKISPNIWTIPLKYILVVNTYKLTDLSIHFEKEKKKKKDKYWKNINSVIPPIPLEWFFLCYINNETINIRLFEIFGWHGDRKKEGEKLIVAFLSLLFSWKKNVGCCGFSLWAHVIKKPLSVSQRNTRPLQYSFAVIIYVLFFVMFYSSRFREI